MSDLQNADIQFHESGEESLQNYRSVNRTSIVGFVLGLLSAASLLHWLLLPIAIAAVLISSLALLQVRARGGELLGRKAALAGIALGIFFLAFATTKEYVRRGELDRQARQHADKWLELLHERDLPNLYKAFELQRRYPERQPLGTDLTLLFGDPAESTKIDSNMVDDELRELVMPRMNFRTFLETPMVEEILEAGSDSEIAFVQVAGRNKKGDNDIVVLEYLIRYKKDNRSKSTRFYVKMARNYYDDIREAHWHVVEIGKNLVEK
jgi:hypothetical protein